MGVNFTDLCRIFIGIIIIIQTILQDVDSAEYCQVYYYSMTCEHGCCGTSCCFNRVSLALGLIFGLIGLVLLCSGFVVCCIQYVYRNKKKIPTRDSYAQTGDPTRGTVMAPTPLPPTFLLLKKPENKKDNVETKLAIVGEENHESKNK